MLFRSRDHDVFILGFTYSSRFGLQYQDRNINFYSGYHNQGFNLEPQELDIATHEVYRYFYTVFGPPWSEQLSDMLIDSLVNFLLGKKKTVLAFSWETRKVSYPMLYPYIGPQHRLPDGHLDIQGTQILYDLLQVQLDEQQR